MTNGYEKTLTENGRRFFVRCFSREIEKRLESMRRVSGVSISSQHQLLIKHQTWIICESPRLSMMVMTRPRMLFSVVR